MTQTDGSCAPATQTQSASPKYLALAHAYLKANPGSHRVTNPCAELAFLNERVDELQQKHVRFQQSYQGVPVWGQQLMVHFNAQDSATSTTGSIVPIAQKLAVEPKLEKTVAATAAIKVIGEGATAQQNQLYIYQHENAPRLVHVVQVSKNLRRTMVFVDAETGDVLNQISATPTNN